MQMGGNLSELRLGSATVLATMSGYAYDRAVTDPLEGVLRDAWHLYRASAGRMLLIAGAIYGPTAGLIALITVNRGSAAWCDAVVGAATFVLIAVVAARPPGSSGSDAPTPIRLATAVVRAAPAAAVLAAVWLVILASIPILKFWDFLVAIPALYLMFMWLLAVPVVIIEDLPVPAGVRRSWRLIHGHGSEVLWALAKAYGISILVMLIPINVISRPAMPVVLHRMIPAIVGGVGYGPFVAIALTLMYYRLAAARSAAELDARSEPSAGPEAAPAG